MARRLFRADCRGFTIAIRGHDFDEFGERLSARATENLTAAVTFIERVLRGDTVGLLADRAKLAQYTDPKKAMTDTAA